MPLDLTADRIVLSAGAIGSAQLLMLSGVGPQEVLRAVGVTVVADLPVGAACADHPEWVLPVNWSATHGLPPLEAVLTTRHSRDPALHSGIRGDGQWATGRPRRPSAHRCRADAARIPRPRERWHPPTRTRRPSSNTGTTVSPRTSPGLTAGAEIARELVGATAQVGAVSWSTSQHLSSTAPMGVDGDAAAVVDTRMPRPRRRQPVGGRRVGAARDHQPRPARHHRDDRSPGGRVRHPVTGGVETVAAALHRCCGRQVDDRDVRRLRTRSC